MGGNNILEKSQLVFDENYIGSIATINDDGSPWSTPLHMVKDGEYIYWFSNEDKIHSRNIARDPRVSLSLFSANPSCGLKGVYVNGRAEMVEQDRRDEIWSMFSSKLGDKVPPGMEKSQAYRLALGDISRDKSTSNCWYFYSQKG